MLIQILGPGCSKCAKLAENAETAAKRLGVDYTLEKVTDIEQIVRRGVMATPAISVDGKVRAVGRVLTSDEIEKILME